MESVVSASMIVLVIRTKRPFLRSTPSKYLSVMTAAVVIVVIVMPYTSIAKLFSFEPLPPVFLIMLAAILLIYVVGAEITKRVFYGRDGV